MKELHTKIALVTGAAQGLGKAIALVLAEKGATVLLNDKKEELLRQAAEEIVQSGGNAIALPADVSKQKEVEQLFSTIQKEFGYLNILVNNAGVSQAKDIFEIKDSDWDFIIRTNLTSGFYCSREAIKMMQKQQEGRIVFISSVVGEQGALYGHVHYAASKAGQLGMTKTLARTGAPLGINVNAIAPGVIHTELIDQVHSPEKIEELRERIPLGLGTPRDIGLAVAFLCGEGGRYITGATLNVNGGLYFNS